MRLYLIYIRNFRGIVEMSLLVEELSVLIGENNTGKSTIIDAVRICMIPDPSGNDFVFSDYDYHLDESHGEPASAEPIEITLTFRESEHEEWDEEIRQDFAEVLVPVDADINCIVLRVTSGFDRESQSFKTEFYFIGEDGNRVNSPSESAMLAKLRQLAPTFYLESKRDATEEFQENSQLWRPLLRAMDIDEKTGKAIEEKLESLNQEVLDTQANYEFIRDKLEEILKIFPRVREHSISIEAVSTKIFNLLSKAQLSMTAQTGVQVPILRHGSGIQSLAVIMLFDAFLSSQLQVGKKTNVSPILLLEEPEAHLHPLAILTIGNMLKNLPGMKIISTHSGDLISTVEFENLYRLAKKNNKIELFRIEPGLLDRDGNKMRRILNHHIRKSKGSLLFSRCWLLVEGECESTILPECGKAMGKDLGEFGVSCVEFANANLEYFIVFADNFGIEWFVLTDNDGAGSEYEIAARNLLRGQNPVSKIGILEHGNLELFLCMNGFEEIYEETITKPVELKMGKSQIEKLKYWTEKTAKIKGRIKTESAVLVAEKIGEKGELAVPELIREVIDRAIALANGVQRND